jgi:hypothetical protein
MVYRSTQLKAQQMRVALIRLPVFPLSVSNRQVSARFSVLLPNELLFAVSSPCSRKAWPPVCAPRALPFWRA